MYNIIPPLVPVADIANQLLHSCPLSLNPVLSPGTPGSHFHLFGAHRLKIFLPLQLQVVQAESCFLPRKLDFL